MNTRCRKTLSDAGFSIVEMMISITVGLIIIAALVGVLVSNTKSSKSNERTSELQENGRYALDHLRTQLRHAGFRGYTWGVKAEQLRVDASTGGATNECLDAGGTSGSFIGNLRQSVWGANDSNPFAANCLATAPLRGDVLVIRRVAGAPLKSGALVGGNHYLRSTYTEAVMFAATGGQLAIGGSPSVAGSPLADYLVQEYVYYIGVADADSSMPALRRLSLLAGSMVDEEVVPGIEHFQVQFSRLSTDLNSQYFDPDGIVGTATAGGFTDWEEVVAVRLWLLSRNRQAESGYANTNSYQMGDVTYTVNDNFRRQLFTSVVQLRNTD
ncbi:MAG: PilW family protein [Gammaproteobacteria bacterium]|nr:hypothetical protein [Sideroxydans sp.]MBU3903402.1 PilW family protein [Gammaproteobacteria bacterium]MBU4045405.1 PilW family protein [Gammaproteobacteria bacterium]